MDQNDINKVQEMIRTALLLQDHKGNDSQRINFFDIFGYVGPINVISQTIGTATGNYDTYFIAEVTGNIIKIDFSALDTLATSDVNYVTWTITNLGQAGAGTAVFLAATDSNTTKTSGGSAIIANTKRTLTLSSTVNDLNVVVGDRIRVRATVTGTLANTVTFPVYLIQTQTQ